MLLSGRGGFQGRVIGNLAEGNGKMHKAHAHTYEPFDLCRLALCEMAGQDLSLTEVCILPLRLEPVSLRVWF